MKTLTAVIALILFAPHPASAETHWYEGWEPKNTLPTQAEETLETQAVVLIPPLEIVREPEPAPQPAPLYDPAVEQWRGIVEVYDWDVNRMLRIMWCESKGNPTAENPRSTATGLFQIMASIWWDGPRWELHDPVLNVDVAYRVYQEQGLGAWVCQG